MLPFLSTSLSFYFVPSFPITQPVPYQPFDFVFAAVTYSRFWSWRMRRWPDSLWLHLHLSEQGEEEEKKTYLIISSFFHSLTLLNSPWNETEHCWERLWNQGIFFILGVDIWNWSYETEVGMNLLRLIFVVKWMLSIETPITYISLFSLLSLSFVGW